MGWGLQGLQGLQGRCSIVGRCLLLAVSVQLAVAHSVVTASGTHLSLRLWCLACLPVLPACAACLCCLPAPLWLLQVATPEDPASARPGESLYAFIPRRWVLHSSPGQPWARCQCGSCSWPGPRGTARRCMCACVHREHRAVPAGQATAACRLLLLPLLLLFLQRVGQSGGWLWHRGKAPEEAGHPAAQPAEQVRRLPACLPARPPGTACLLLHSAGHWPRATPLPPDVPWFLCIAGCPADRAAACAPARLPARVACRMVWWVGCPLALASAAFAFYGWAGLTFAVGQAVIR